MHVGLDDVSHDVLGLLQTILSSCDSYEYVPEVRQHIIYKLEKKNANKVESKNINICEINKNVKLLIQTTNNPLYKENVKQELSVYVLRKIDIIYKFL